MNDTNDINVGEVLASNYMLASLVIPKWGGTKKDDEATAELLRQKGAVGDAATVVKKLLAGNDKELEDCKAAFDRIRTWFYANSLPWTIGEGSRRGSRLVGVTQVMTFLRDFANLKRQAEEALDKFLDVYDVAVQNTATSLAGLYRPSEYPTKDQLRSKFGAFLDIVPMPAVSDYDRVAIPGAMASGLKNLYEKKAQRQVETAVDDCQARLVKELERMSTQLGKVADGKDARLHQSLIDNMKTVASLAESLGPLRPELQDVAKRIDAELLKHELKAYKDNAPLARKVAETATALAKELAGVCTVTVNQPQEEVTPLVLATSNPAPVAQPDTLIEFDEDSVFNVGL